MGTFLIMSCSTMLRGHASQFNWIKENTAGMKIVNVIPVCPVESAPSHSWAKS